MAALKQSNTSSAYDLSLFEQKKERTTQRQNLKVVRGSNPFSGTILGLSPMTLFLTTLMVVGVTSFFIYNNVILTELSAQLSTTSNQLAELQNENVLLQSSLESKMSVRNIENGAENNLGLAKVERSQIKYINLEPEDAVEVEQKGTEQGLLETIMAKIKEYLNL